MPASASHSAESSPSRCLVTRLSWPYVLCSLLALTFLLRVCEIDRQVMSLVSTPGQAAVFPWGQMTFWALLYKYGEVPGIVVGCCGFPLLLLSIVPRYRKYAPLGAYLCLGCIIGPGLIVNNGLKSHWGRPRPRETLEYGGREQFVHVGSLGNHVPNGSFPSGHAAIAFFVLAPAFFRCQWRSWRPAWLAVGLTFGTLVGTARVLQGGHYPTDILWSLAVIYLVCWLLAVLLRIERVTLFAPAANALPHAAPLANAA